MKLHGCFTQDFQRSRFGFFFQTFEKETSNLIASTERYRWCSQKMWNASRFCMSSLHRGHANLLCIVPILVYVLPKQVQLKRQKLALYFSVSTFFVDVVRLKSKYKHPSHTGVEPRTWDWKSTVLSSALLELLL